MAYLRTEEKDTTVGALGCGPGCRCGSCKSGQFGLGERYIRDDDQDEPGRTGSWGEYEGYGLGASVSVDPKTGTRCQVDERRITHPIDPPPSELVDVEPRYLANPGARRKLHRAAYGAFRALKQAAERDGVPPPILTVVSGYRSTEQQRGLYAAALKRYGSPQEARKWVAPPGGSPHHTGRAIDFYLGSKNSSSNVAALRATPAYHWMVCNASRFGFTPYTREPWHWEYNPPGFSPSSTPGHAEAPSRNGNRRSTSEYLPTSSRRPSPNSRAGRPTPPRSSAVQLLKRENQPPSFTLYMNFVLGGEAPAKPMTGIFVPQNYRSGPEVDLILYLHGHHRGGNSPQNLTIDGYWNRMRYPYFDFREGVNASGKNVILVAPTLGPRSQAGRLMQAGGLDWYLGSVLQALRQHGSYQGATQAPTIRTLILGCHSGGGYPMRQLATAPSRYSSAIRECWGFDCLYNGGDEDIWAKWAAAHPSSRLYIHYGSGGTAGKSEQLRAKGVANVVVEGSVRLAHNLVPKTHWQERLGTATFLSNT